MRKMCIALLLLVLVQACKEGDKKANSPAVAMRKAANETEENIYRCGDSMMASFKNKDWVTFAKYNHPNMVKMMGGPTAFASFVGQQMNQIPDTAIKSIVMGKILQIVTTGKDKQCVVEQNMKMRLEGFNIEKTTYLIGESLDGGLHWTFLDASPNSGLLPKNIKPDISDQLKIPAAKNNMYE